MIYQFDDTIDRSRTNSFKWKAKNLENSGKVLYPMWVADMEFSVSPAIAKRLSERVEEGVFGYELLSDKYYDAVKYWLKKRHGCSLENDDILYCAGSMSGLSAVLQTFTEKNDEILVNVPVYGNFYNVIKGCGRIVSESRLLEVNGRFTFDLEDMRRQVSKKTKGVLLCNPHNPTGTVWTEDELRKICSFCKKYNLFIISAEVHYDFVFSGRHIMVREIAGEYNVPVITIISPGKSFNVAGIQTAALLVQGYKMKQMIKDTMSAMAYPFEHSFAQDVTVGAYLESEDWFDAVYEYIKENRELTVNYIKNNLPLLRVPQSDATYLLWIDCSAMRMTEDDIMGFWRDKCGVLPSDGREFGEAGRQYVRLNLACPRENLKRVLDNIKAGFEMLCR